MKVMISDPKYLDFRYGMYLQVVLFSLLSGLSHDLRGQETELSVLEIGDSKQLFMDDFIIEAEHGVNYKMHTPTYTGEVLVEADLPTEKGGHVYLYSSVMKDSDGKIKMWYDFFRPKSDDPYDHDRHVAYAESTDGLHFTKPMLEYFEVDGTRQNNVVIPGVIGGASVWIDPLAESQHRYKSQSKVYPSGKFQMHSSPDGLRWKLLKEIDPKGPYDTQTIVFWDERIEEYLFYGRYFFDDNGVKSRGVRRALLKDFTEVINTNIVIEPDMRDRMKYGSQSSVSNTVDYYGATVFPYEENKSIYIMLAQAFWHWVPNTTYQGTEEPGMRDVRLAVSRDSKTFQRVGDRAAFMTPGPMGRFDSKQIWALPNPIIMGDEIWFYYNGVNWDRAGRVDPLSNGVKKAGISRAVLRLDGFVSVNASYDQIGELVTKPFRFNGDRLEVNANTGAGGSIRIEILNAKGEVISGFGKDKADWIVGNSVRHTATWGGNASVDQLQGEVVRLRFILQDCELYAFQFQ